MRVSPSGSVPLLTPPSRRAVRRPGSPRPGRACARWARRARTRSNCAPCSDRQQYQTCGVPLARGGSSAAMSEPRIGRVLVASLHQAIADLLPTRLEFYENWLNVSGLREGTIGLAPLSAVLSFLRTEGQAYDLITTRAGEYAADWTVNRPRAARAARDSRAAGGAARPRRAPHRARARPVDTYPGSRAIVRARSAAPRRSTCAARCSARSGKRPCSRCAASTRPPSRGSCTCSRFAPMRASASAAPPATGKGCLLSVVVGGAHRRRIGRRVTAAV